jgi:hypothetical protein
VAPAQATSTYRCQLRPRPVAAVSILLLREKLEEVNDAKRLVRRVPSLSEVTRWIDEAKALPRAVTY